MELYKEECVYHFCILNNYLSRYFCCFPTEVINLINYHYITIYGLINKLPFVCDKPGNYYVTQNLDYYGDGTAIKIISSEVTVDLQQNTITNYGLEYTVVAYQVKNFTIKNGIIYSSHCMDINNTTATISNMGIYYRNNGQMKGDTGPPGILVVIK